MAACPALVSLLQSCQALWQDHQTPRADVAAIQIAAPMLRDFLMKDYGPCAHCRAREASPARHPPRGISWVPMADLPHPMVVCPKCLSAWTLTTVSSEDLVTGRKRRLGIHYGRYSPTLGLSLARRAEMCHFGTQHCGCLFCAAEILHGQYWWLTGGPLPLRAFLADAAEHGCEGRRMATKYLQRAAHEVRATAESLRDWAVRAESDEQKSDFPLPHLGNLAKGKGGIGTTQLAQWWADEAFWAGGSAKGSPTAPLEQCDTCGKAHWLALRSLHASEGAVRLCLQCGDVQDTRPVSSGEATRAQVSSTQDQRLFVVARKAETPWGAKRYPAWYSASYQYTCVYCQRPWSCTPGTFMPYVPDLKILLLICDPCERKRRTMWKRLRRDLALCTRKSSDQGRTQDWQLQRCHRCRGFMRIMRQHNEDKVLVCAGCATATFNQMEFPIDDSSSSDQEPHSEA